MIVAYLDLAESQRCWGTAVELEQRGIARRIRRRYAIHRAHAYLDRAERLGLPADTVRWWRDYLTRNGAPT